MSGASLKYFSTILLIVVGERVAACALVGTALPLIRVRPTIINTNKGKERCT
jgi:hypothetical protein